MKTLAVFGLGLIGGSFALGLKQRLFHRVVGFDSNPMHLKQALALGIIDEVGSRLSDIEDLDMVLLAVPVRAYESVLMQLQPCLEVIDSDYVLTDVGSVKVPLVTAARKVMGELPSNWVLAHPIAGSEQHGPEAAHPELFKSHKVILTPCATTDILAIERVRRAWSFLGAQVETLSVTHHDQVLARTSHLPHFLAYALVSDLVKQSDNLQIFHYAAGGFRDFTRIAASSPVMWHDIFFSNKEAVISALASYIDELKEYQVFLEKDHSEELLARLTDSRSARVYFQALLERRGLSEVSLKSPINFIATGFEQLSQQGTLKGDIHVPGDKSISHRAIMLGAIAEGTTEIEGFLEGEDSLATLQAFRAMGVQILGPDDGKVVIKGVGLSGLKPPKAPLYMGNSGTAMRLLSGLLSGQAFSSTLEGDASLSQRPMQRVIDPLQLMGANIRALGAKGTPPVCIEAASKAGLKSVSYELPMASAQVKSSVLLAGLYAKGEIRVVEPEPTRDHSERMLQAMGCDLRVQGGEIRMRRPDKLQAVQIHIPGDISSAAFLIVAAILARQSDLCIRDVGINPTRDGVIQILRLMGANIRIENERLVGKEPVADLFVSHSELKGIDIPQELVPLAIDEFPVIFIAAACAMGVTRVTGAKELRVKESDRISAMVEGLNRMGVAAIGTEDGAIIPGCESEYLVFNGGTVESQGDHRIAMAFTVASLRAKADIRILDCANVDTSFPDFLSVVNGVGLQVVSEKA